MKETVLLYNFTDRERALKIRQALLPLGFRLKAVDKKDYRTPVGVLAGVKGMTENVDSVEPDANAGSGFDDEMILMAGFTSARIDALIGALRKRGVGRIDYKAVLTDTNKYWDSLTLYEEIKKEHETMSARQEQE